MAEITQKEGTWAFDGEVLRLVPGRGRGVHQLRIEMGEVSIPLAAIAGVSYEPGRKGGRLRLRMREGADPFTQGAPDLPDAANPYSLQVDKDRAGAAEYLADAVRNALLLEQVPVDTPSDRYLLPGPPVPRVFQGSDGRVHFDGEQVRIEWDWGAEEVKKSAGPRTIPLSELERVEWTRATWENGSLRFVPKGNYVPMKGTHDPYAVVLWGLREAREIAQGALMVAAVSARLPHPSGGTPAEPARLTKEPHTPGEKREHDHDGLLRRLRELGELRASGVLTEEEFTQAKRALLERF
ncbi:DUF4429 domain-containing protein [Streptomyces sp. ACA25]|uniref:DUF4429 domain-containing protein n=1 Tax=Streptomyces sp. ACA25 TaxID=3022596 RepID=UPI002306DE03|nr:DUF4429 domain-containing protein [Streptomyces sp. ACA25]MDB1086102.1 DUF4429 domain-containing protein [Streptomyces sp. ACA25]